MGLLPVLRLGLGVLTGVMLSDVIYLLMTKQQAVLPGWTCACLWLLSKQQLQYHGDWLV